MACSAEEFRVDGTATVPAIRLSLTATRSRERLEEGFVTVRRVLAGTPPRAPLL